MFNENGSPHDSKKKLFFAYGKLFEVLTNLATQETLKFPDLSGKREVVDHYIETWKNLSPLGKSLKKAAEREKVEKDELRAEQQRLHRLRFRCPDMSIFALTLAFLKDSEGSGNLGC